MKSFNVIVYDFNRKKFIPYDVIPYLIGCYWDRVKRHTEPNDKIEDSYLNDIRYFKIPKTFTEFREFVKNESMYQFWSRCEYEIILSDWPPSKPPVEEKWDVWDQIKMNLDIVTQIVMDAIKYESCSY